MRDPEDYDGGVEEMIADKESDPYDDLIPLGQRKSTEIKLRGGDGASEAEMAQKFGYSMPIALLFRMTQKMYGYMRDGNISDPLEVAAVKGANSLNDVIFDAECLNRQGRYDEEKESSRQWLALANQEKRDSDSPDIDVLLRKWSEADAFMLQATIVEEQQGIDAAKPLYPKFIEMQEQRDVVQMAAAQLSAPENMLFWCRVRMYQIMRERAHDLALGYPTHDFTEVKRQLAEGGNVHDLVPDMAWPWREGYQLVMGSTADGGSYREMMMSMVSQTLPQQTPPNWGMPPGYFPPYMNGDGHQSNGENEEQPDKRRAIFGIFGGNGNKQPQEPEKQQIRRRSRGKR